MVTKHQIQSAKKLMIHARAVLTGRNFVKARILDQLLEMTSQRASDILRAMPEWRMYSNGYRGCTWAREGFPLG